MRYRVAGRAAVDYDVSSNTCLPTTLGFLLLLLLLQL